MIFNASGNLYDNNKILDKAYEYILKVNEQWQQINDYQDMFYMQHTLISLAIAQNEFYLAQQHIEIMLELSQKNPQFQDFLFQLPQFRLIGVLKKV